MQITMENMQKRGRPKLEEISSLIKEGVQSKSPIRCRFCKRAFPREKSLQAHQRIHTGERPYRCTHPGCHKSFVQSGQLRTHQRLHTGEKPFRCNECKNRFTHANRRCPDHPNAGVRRDEHVVLYHQQHQNQKKNESHDEDEGMSDEQDQIIINDQPLKKRILNRVDLDEVNLMYKQQQQHLLREHLQNQNNQFDHHQQQEYLQNQNHQHLVSTAKPKPSIIIPSHQHLQQQQHEQKQMSQSNPRSALCNYEQNFAYISSWQRGDEILGALALIELSQCH